MGHPNFSFNKYKTNIKINMAYLVGKQKIMIVSSNHQDKSWERACIEILITSWDIDLENLIFRSVNIW